MNRRPSSTASLYPQTPRFEPLEPRNLFNADLTGSYVWDHVNISGGGFVTGIVSRPNDPDSITIRTDVGGAYRYDPNASRWGQLVTADSMPADSVAYRSFGGVEGIAVNPNNSQIILLSKRLPRLNDPGNPLHNPNGRNGSVFRSTDGGESFTRSNLNIELSPNDRQFRAAGERMLIDPRNTNVVYYGTRENGLRKSTNGGLTFTTTSLSGISNTANVLTVVADPTGGGQNGQTRRLYAGVGDDVYRSNNAGASWNKINDVSGGPGANLGEVTDMDLADDGTLFVTFRSGSGAGAVYSYTSGGTWTNITPFGNRDYRSVEVDPNNGDRVIVAQPSANLNQKIWELDRSTGQWQSLNMTFSAPDSPWNAYADTNFFAHGEIMFDPVVNDRVWVAQGLGVWRADNISSGTVNWVAVNEGLEEMVTNDSLVAPGGKLVTAVWDRTGFYHADLDQAPDVHIPNGVPGGDKFSSGWDVDYSHQNPDRLVVISDNHQKELNNNPGAERRLSSYSTDGGQTWNLFGSLENGNHPDELEFGNIAISSTNPNKIVWLPTDNTAVYYTTNGGDTWTQTNSAGTNVHRRWSDPLEILAADPVNGNTFYLYDPRWQGGRANSARLLRSTNGGQTWSEISRGELPVGNGAFAAARMVAAPGRSGDLWFTGADARDPVARYQVASDTVTTFTFFTEAFDISFGKEAPGSNYPTVFVAGRAQAGDTGVWRSTDQGATWDKVVEYPLGIFDQIKTITGDPNVFGRVYVGMQGKSFFYGEPTGANVGDTVTIDFENAPPSSTNAPYTERGFTFAPNGSKKIVRSAGTDGFGLKAANWNTTLTVTQSGGATFGLDAVDLIANVSAGISVTVTGQRSGGGTFTAVYDSSTNGNRLNLNWSDLDSVTFFSSRSFTIDQFVADTASAQTTTLTFDQLSTSSSSSPYTESGYRFSVPSSRNIRGVDVNGDRRLTTVNWNTTLTLERVNGAAFTLESLRVTNNASNTRPITITGFFTDGTTRTRTLTPDAGQTWSPSLNWASLEYVEIFGERQFGLDDVVVA